MKTFKFDATVWVVLTVEAKDIDAATAKARATLGRIAPAINVDETLGMVRDFQFARRT